MHSLADLLHPITPDRFMADYHGRKPLHIPAEAGGAKQALLDWQGFNALLSQTSIWTPQTLKLIHNGKSLPAQQYCDEVHARTGRTLRPSPAKVEVCLSLGASLVADDVHTLTPALVQASAMLGEAFAGLVGANLYCSFGGVQAFGTHYDLHDVFAVHLEGEKVWRLYSNQANNPVEFAPEQDPGWLERTRGSLVQEVRMRPGDVLYLPRGWYHDALADSAASLHVTFSVTPLYGRILFGLLESAAMQDPAFRAWLPSAHQDSGRALGDHLADLGKRLAALAAHPQIRDDVAMSQQRLRQYPARYSLPARKSLTSYQRAGMASPPFSGPVAIAMQWAFNQSRFALEDLCAQFDFIDDAVIIEAVEKATRAGALVRVS